jgi:hypothetical protein
MSPCNANCAPVLAAITDLSSRVEQGFCEVRRDISDHKAALAVLEIRKQNEDDAKRDQKTGLLFPLLVASLGLVLVAIKWLFTR